MIGGNTGLSENVTRSAVNADPPMTTICVAVIVKVQFGPVHEMVSAIVIVRGLDKSVKEPVRS